MVTADATAPLPPTVTPASFDVVVDKGLLDALLCSERGEVAAWALLSGAAAALRPGGALICVSHVPSADFQALLQPPSAEEGAAAGSDSACDWKISTAVTVPGAKPHHVHVVTKT